MRSILNFFRCTVLAALLLLLPGQARAFSILWLSDTQNYSYSNFPIFEDMIDWVIENPLKLDFQYAIHTGDVVGGATRSAAWESMGGGLDRRRRAMPLVSVAGNHDRIRGKDRLKNYTAACVEGRYDAQHVFDGGRAIYGTFSAEGMDVLMVGLSYEVYRDEAAIAWVNDVLAAHPEHYAILFTHSYMYARGGRLGGGQAIFEQVVQPNPNVRLVLCGHTRGANRLTDDIDDDGDGVPDRTVVQLLANYQNVKPGGGAGYLRLLRFDTSMDRILVNTYSPYLDDYLCFDGGRDFFTIESAFSGLSEIGAAE